MIGTNPKLKPLAPYSPYPWQLPALRDKSLVVLLTGSAGGGKSRCALEKCHAFMLKYGGATGLILRKAREFVNKSSVPMMYHTIMGGVKSGVEMVKSDSLFRYPNGSMLWWGGMKDDDQREAVRSIGQTGGLDFVVMEEGNAFTEDDFNEILGRMRGTAGSWRQVIIATNPDAPNHWINQRLILGRQARIYYSSASDNPANPSEYLQTLQLLTGTLYERLVLGKWVLAEGAIYDNFSYELNVTEEAEYRPGTSVYWAVDDGYALGHGKGSRDYHPRVVLLAQKNGRGGWHIFGEYIKCQEQSDATLSNVLALPYGHPEMAYVDSSAAELIGRMVEAQIYTVPATHIVTEGIKVVRRLLCDGQGTRLIKIHPRCVDTIAEFQSYHYDDSLLAVGGERKPAKIDDHCMDALRYLCSDSIF